MKIIILGAGGVGGYFGAQLMNAGYKVNFLARGEHYLALKTNGLKIISKKGDAHIPSVSVFNDIDELPQADLIILALKTWQVEEIIPDLKKIIHKETTILTLQNGVSIPYDLAKVHPNNTILGGVCKIISKIEAPGIIIHQGVEPQIEFGCVKGNNASIELEVKSLFDSAGITNKISKDIQADLWKKYIGICLGALLVTNNCTYGELVSIPEYRSQMVDLLKEIHGLALKIGVRISPNFVEKLIPFIEGFPKNSKSSMARDIESGRPSELKHLNGMVVELGKQHKYPTPINEELYQLLEPLEREARAIE